MDFICNIMFIKENDSVSEHHGHARRDTGKVILSILARLKGPQGNKPVERPAFKIVKPERVRDPARHRPLARGRRPVDGDHGNAHDRIFFQESKNPGKVLATQPGSLMVTGTPPSATSEKLIAMRWSS